MSRKIQKRGFFMKRRPSYRDLKKWLTLAAVLLGLLYGTIFLFPVVPNQSNTVDGSSYRVKINPNSGLTSISDQLGAQGLAINSVALHLGARSLFLASKLKPGTYLLPNGASLGKVLFQIARGDRVREAVAIIPGMTIWQLRALMDSQSAMIHRTKGMSNKELLQQLNLNYPSDEGLFLPDTYVFDPDELDLNIYRRAAQAMQKQLMQIWEQKESGLPLKTPYELLILASIVEKETGRLSDRNLVSAVFINRLNKGMPLQTDPTVIYGIGPKFDGNLKKADLRRDTPYNTYMHKGLPPTPIAMPSKESILAAAHPAKSNVLFFVAKGDGSSHFSQNLKEHEAAVDRYQRKIMPKNNSN
ncbi:endolytic transglycosylase MltG [Polynucleobacter sp. 86C-FISCH]|uniref:endolytic transglycosylase MltG n=1 Tax=Polynucleobacter sp. 86C-FISCH TaxID=2689101 RepID=UPI001C0BCFBE|nr:endolytic transglycosylase MltG [Polynucleobacter sp. 86C-FISCH]MBU3596607.1 endolytic transglycosylase MltG [Polynucleobacter sp. 86C-FISCH]